MDKDSLFDAKLPEDFSSVGLVGAPTNPQPGIDASRTIKRENDSVDDFEHLDHEGSPLDETARNVLDVTSVQLIDVPRTAPASRVSELMDVASKLERNILDTSIPADERILQPVPATPPPSADFEKFERQLDDVTSAQTLNKFDAKNSTEHRQYQVNEIRQVDPKVATMAFMDTERICDDYHNLRKEHAEKEAVEEEEEDDRVPQQLQQHQQNLDNRSGDFELEADEHAKQPQHRDAPQDLTEENNGETSKVAARLAPDKSVAADDDKYVHGDRDTDEKIIDELSASPLVTQPEPKRNDYSVNEGFLSNIESSVIPGPQKSPEFDFLADDGPAAEVKKMPGDASRNLMDDDTWNVVEKPEQQQQQQRATFAAKEAENVAKNEREFFEAPTKPLPPLPKSDMDEEDEDRNFGRRMVCELTQDGKYEMSMDFMGSGGADASTQRGSKSRGQQQQSGTETGDSEFESAPEQSPAKSSVRSAAAGNSGGQHARKINADDIAPKEIFTDMGLDAWFNPERLNPKVAALIYWRQPEKTGIVFGAVLGVLLSLAYFSLISVFAYLSLLTLTGTVGFRVYKTFMQAVQKTSDGHPFKDILEVDLTLPAEKVHEVADVAVAHANAAFAELRRLFLVEDFIDSLKFGVVLWCFTYLGSWFNGMTLIIIGVVALFTLPKVYETNKAQIDQNLALVHGKINELTAKVKAAIPLGKKAEPTKEE